MIALASATYAPIVYIIGTLLTGGALQVVYTFVRNYKRGPIDDDSIIAQTVRDDVEGLRNLLAEYRLETEVNKRQLEGYQKDLREMTRELAAAQVRIGSLEKQLREGGERRAAIERELSEIRKERDRLEKERNRLAEEADKLQQRIEALERATGITEALRETHPPDRIDRLEEGAHQRSDRIDRLEEGAHQRSDRIDRLEDAALGPHTHERAD